ncbi:hypothetical protein HRM2_05600 [Desulforapulum autotrophicum HRM2]|uniref:Uncharacterized protein n=1 Tax=Desulforapulum autotrophicum (strain ATCC 43914 / DSM 3382 / VKM B-1955 / HRM2) TaxID=177437 RepID=C0QHW6_DESAH|nr:hypothetical protein HRM2_05600 [Desulforapulum autotrophicum HRM2]
MFQSLLSWIRHSRKRAEVELERAKCFNPCCRGSGIPGIHFKRLFELAFEFQSLLSWIRHSRTSHCIPIGISCAVSILVVVDQAFQDFRSAGNRMREKFQSLLSWIRHSRSKSSYPHNGQ